MFFVFFGLSTNPADIPPVLLPAALLAIITTFTKIGTGYYAARRAGVGSRGRWRAGGTLVARGEFSIVIAGLAVATEPRIGPIATAYVLILVIVGPLTARWTQPIAAKIEAVAAAGHERRPGEGARREVAPERRLGSTTTSPRSPRATSTSSPGPRHRSRSQKPPEALMGAGGSAYPGGPGMSISTCL